MSVSTSFAALAAAFSCIEKIIEFKPEFNNGTGYLDGLAELEGLYTPSELNHHVAQQNIYKMTGDDNRIAIVVATRFGNVVMFQRFNKDDSVVCAHTPRRIGWFLCNEGIRTMSAEDIFKMTGLVIGNCSGPRLNNPNLSKYLDLVMSENPHQ